MVVGAKDAAVTACAAGTAGAAAAVAPPPSWPAFGMPPGDAPYAAAAAHGVAPTPPMAAPAAPLPAPAPPVAAPAVPLLTAALLTAQFEAAADQERARAATAALLAAKFSWYTGTVPSDPCCAERGPSACSQAGVLLDSLCVPWLLP
ncbi:translation initiation factor IF-2-like [Panicum virgatum]|uniref:translation initiation factor IF-2-like n=1 Tax=Panicum virgatum TaxID=38727 RepID=UPI0019D5D625|nr:translation initiation factor IF-2-like [Panicum virgatum]